MIRRATLFLLLGILLPALAPRAEAQSWFDGLFVNNTDTACLTTIVEPRVVTYVGFFGNTGASLPSVGTTYYIHIVISHPGNPCVEAGTYVDIQPPANTTLAIDAQHPVFCFKDGVRFTSSVPGIAGFCPATLPASSLNPGAFQIPSGSAADANTWGLAAGHILEFQIPVKSSTALSGSTMQGNVLNDLTWLRPQQGVYVFQPATPSVTYGPVPVTNVTSTSARLLASVATAGTSGTAFFDWGTTAAYGSSTPADDSVALPPGGWDLYDDLGLSPATPLVAGTTYHWRIRYVTSGNLTFLGADRTFATVATAAAAPAITAQPASMTVTAGQTVSFVAAASGVPAPTVQWQVQTGASFTAIPGATAVSYTFTSAAGDTGKVYRALFTNASGSAASGTALLTVNVAPSITVQPPNVTANIGQTGITFSAAATGNPAPAVQWQVSGLFQPFTNIPGATSTTYTVPTPIALANGRSAYRAIFTNSIGTITTRNAQLAVRPGLIADYDLDRKADLPIWRASTGTWFWLTSVSGYDYGSQRQAQWGSQALGDVPLSGDIDGDGKADLVIWRASTGMWFWLTSSTAYSVASFGQKQWGNASVGDVPMLADLDHDGKADLIVWRASTGTWFWLNSSTGYDYALQGQVQWGNNSLGDKPFAGDIDGDGVAELAVWRSSNGTWYWLLSPGFDYATATLKQWGNASLGDVPLLGDVDGDDKADLVMWRASTGTWFWLTSSSAYDYAAQQQKQWGNSGLGDVPMLSDLDGDRKADLAVWRASTGTWFWLTSTTGYSYATGGVKQWGNKLLGDVPMIK